MIYTFGSLCCQTNKQKSRELEEGQVSPMNELILPPPSYKHYQKLKGTETIRKLEQ